MDACFASSSPSGRPMTGPAWPASPGLPDLSAIRSRDAQTARPGSAQVRQIKLRGGRAPPQLPRNVAAALMRHRARKRRAGPFGAESAG